MKRTQIIRSSAALVGALVLAGCGGGDPADSEIVAERQAPESCRTAAVPADVASGAVDSKRLRPGGKLNKSQNEYTAGTTEQLLNAYPAIALVQATTRSQPTAVAGSVVGARPTDALSSRPTAASDKPFQVVRPATFQVMKQLRGTVPTCLDLAIPGGSTGQFAEDDASFPRRIAVGEPLLAFFSDVDLAQNPPGLGLLLAPQADGTYILPFPGSKPIDLATWQIPPYEQPEVTTVPGGVRPEPVEPAE